MHRKPLDADLDELGYYFEVRDGRIEQSLQPGRYQARFQDEDYEEKWEGEISISEGTVVEQQVDLRPD